MHIFFPVVPVYVHTGFSSHTVSASSRKRICDLIEMLVLGYERTRDIHHWGWKAERLGLLVDRLGLDDAEILERLASLKECLMHAYGYSVALYPPSELWPCAYHTLVEHRRLAAACQMRLDRARALNLRPEEKRKLASWLAEHRKRIAELRGPVSSHWF